jgi:hypothetical protein
VLTSLLPTHPCPLCKGRLVHSAERSMAGDLAITFLAELQFWFALGVCVAIGLWSWVAGFIAGVAALAVLMLYEINQPRYRCSVCQASCSYAEAWRAGRAAEHDA